MLSITCCSAIDGSLSRATKWFFHQAWSSYFPVIIVLWWKASSSGFTFEPSPTHSTHNLVNPFGIMRVCKSGVQLLLLVTIYFWVLCICQSWSHVWYLVITDLVFLLSMLFLARFLLLIKSFCSILFSSNHSSCFLTPVLSFSLDTKTDLKAYHFSSTAPVKISASLSFNEACRLSVTLLILIVLVLDLTCFKMDLIITWSQLLLTPPIALVFRNSDRSRCHVMI